MWDFGLSMWCVVAGFVVMRFSGLAVMTLVGWSIWVVGCITAGGFGWVLVFWSRYSAPSQGFGGAASLCDLDCDGCARVVCLMSGLGVGFGCLP